MDHTPLHLLGDRSPATTAGRLRKTEHGWEIFNAYVVLRLILSPESAPPADLGDGDLVRVRGQRTGDRFAAEAITVARRPGVPPTELEVRPSHLPVGQALRAHHRLRRRIRRFFDDRDFLEVHTRALQKAPGTDPHIEPVPVDYYEPYGDEASQTAYLHTSPELAMKRLLVAGAGPIYQLTRAWRNGEVTALHNPEFCLLEWYRPWRDVEAIIDDVEALVCEILDADSDRPVDGPIRRMTMQQVVDAACGFDLLEALDAGSLRRQIERHGLLSDRAMKQARWDELFFSLTVSHIDPYLKDQGAVFVTDWPAPLAILARRRDDDPRVAARFELYVDGVELANGFGELTNPEEQRRRFRDDNATREELGLRRLPIPKTFLRALARGMPPSAGVALGVDRLLVLATEGASTLRDVRPFALYRDVDGVQWS